MNLVLVGLDGSSREPLVLATSIAMARAFGGRLHFLRSVSLPPPEVPMHVYAMAAEPLADALLGDARRAVEESIKDIPKDLVHGTSVVLGVPWDTICRLAEDLHVDLVIIGSHGYSGLDRILGTTASKVVNHLKRSVLVVRPKPDKD